MSVSAFSTPCLYWWPLSLRDQLIRSAMVVSEDDDDRDDFGGGGDDDDDGGGDGGGGDDGGSGDDDDSGDDPSSEQLVENLGCGGHVGAHSTLLACIQVQSHPSI